jgi:hypothetical protein
LIFKEKISLSQKFSIVFRIHNELAFVDQDYHPKSGKLTIMMTVMLTVKLTVELAGEMTGRITVILVNKKGTGPSLSHLFSNSTFTSTE